MSKPEPPPLPSNTPSQFAPPPAPPSAGTPASASTVYEYVMSFDKPLTRDEKMAWLMLVVHYIQSGFLPESIYPTLCNKVASLPEVLPVPNRPIEKIPGSDYIHPGPPKPYQVLLKMYEGNKPISVPNVSEAGITYAKSKDDSSSLMVLGFVVFVAILGFVAYGIGSWAMKSPSKLDHIETASVAVDVEPVSLEVKTDNPFAEEPTDNPFENGALETTTDNPFAEKSDSINSNPHFDSETKIHTYEAEDGKLLGRLRVLTSHPGGYPSTGYTGKGYVENFRERDDICVFDVSIEEDGYYDLDFVSASLNGLFKANRISLDEKHLGDVKIESKPFTSSRLDRIFLSQGNHTIKYAMLWGYVALDKLVISPTDSLRVRLIDENGFELQLVTDDTAIRTTDFMRQPFLFNNKKIFLESCTDRTTGMTVYRIEPMQSNGSIGIGFQYLEESRLPKISINGNRAVIESKKKGNILIGWTSASALVTPTPRKELKVIRAKYGSNDRSSDVTDSVKGFVIGDSLTFRVDNATFGDPAPGSGKNLVLTYSLDGEERTETFNENQNVQVQYDPQDQFYRLKTNGNSTLEFVVAYGRKTLPEKLPTFEEVARNNPHFKEVSSILDNPFEDSIATDNPFAE